MDKANSFQATPVVSLPVLGMDVSKAKVDVALLDIGRGSKIKSKVISNDAKGWTDLARWLASHHLSQVHACCEATGVYWEALAVALADAGHLVSVVNPAQIHAFGQVTLARNKTDKQDARLIARFCASQRPAAWVAPAPEVRVLLALVRDAQFVKASLNQETNRLETAHGEVAPGIARRVAFLTQELTALQEAIKGHIDRHPGLRTRRELLDSIPGLGDETIPWLLAFVDARFDSAKQVVSFAGLNPQHRQSGTSVHGRSRTSKIGHAELRRALYMPGVVAYSRAKAYQPFVQRLKLAGKAPKVIIVALMRKLLTIAWTVLKSGKPFDPRMQNA